MAEAIFQLMPTNPQHLAISGPENAQVLYYSLICIIPVWRQKFISDPQIIHKDLFLSGIADTLRVLFQSADHFCTRLPTKWSFYMSLCS
jgi:hypothetical protein